MILKMFIAMDPPEHDDQRRAVHHVVAPRNLKEFEALIRRADRGGSGCSARERAI